MPVVPSPVVGDVTQRVADSPQATPDSFGAVQGQEISQAGAAGLSFGNDMTSLAVQQENMANRAAVRDALATYQEGTNGYLQDNVLSKQGKDAIGLIPSTQTALQNLREQTNQTLTPRQQAMFSTLAPAVDRRAIMLNQRHEAMQTKAYNQQTLTSELASDTHAAAMDYNNPDLLKQALTTAQANAPQQAPGEPARAQMLAVTNTSGVLKSVASAMAANDPASAKVFLQKYQGQMVPQDFDELSKSVDNQLTKSAADNLAYTANPNLPAAQQAIDAITDPKLKALAQAEFDTHSASLNSAAALDAANKDSQNALTVTRNPAQAAMMLPKDLPPEQQTKLISAANARIQAQQNGQPIQTDPDVYSSLIHQAANDPDGFIRRPLTPYLNQLSDHDFNEISGIRAGIEKSRETTVDKALNSAAIDSTFRSSVKGIPELSMYDGQGKPLKPGPDMQARAQQINTFRNDFLNRLRTQYPDAQSRTPQNAQTILDGMVSQKIINKGWFSNTSTPQGLVDENPSLDRTGTNNFPAAIPGLTATTLPNGTGAFLDPATKTIYDKSGTVLGQWKPKVK